MSTAQACFHELTHLAEHFEGHTYWPCAPFLLQAWVHSYILSLPVLVFLGYRIGYQYSFTWFFSLTFPATILYTAAFIVLHGDDFSNIGLATSMSDVGFGFIVFPSTGVYLVILTWVCCEAWCGRMPKMPGWRVGGFLAACLLHWVSIQSLHPFLFEFYDDDRWWGW
jgi:hypothetical protein